MSQTSNEEPTVDEVLNAARPEDAGEDETVEPVTEAATSNAAGPQATQTVGGDEVPTSTQEQVAANPPENPWFTLIPRGHVEARNTDGDGVLEVRLVQDGPGDHEPLGKIDRGILLALFQPPTLLSGTATGVA